MCSSDLGNLHMLGWLPDGPAYCRYSVRTHASTDGRSDDMTISATCDVDGDGVEAVSRAHRAEKATMVTPSDAC